MALAAGTGGDLSAATFSLASRGRGESDVDKEVETEEKEQEREESLVLLFRRKALIETATDFFALIAVVT